MTKDSTDSRNAQGVGDQRPPVSAAGLRSPLTLASVTFANRAFLAPLSGISDVPFRRLARRFGAGMVVSEMVASGEYVKGQDESRLRAMRDGPGLHVVQLAGRDPIWMRGAAARLAASGVDVIDINMGCPAKKVVGGLSGSALMREPDLALRLIEATVSGAGRIPVTLKMRLGWDRRNLNAPEIAARAEAAGVRMVTVHGRTRSEFYGGRADWRAIAAVKRAVSIPLVANGDLASDQDLAAMLAQSGADAVMVGRGAQGRPWLPGLLAGATDRARLERIAFADLVVEHYEAMLGHYGIGVGARHARKHLGWYLQRFADAGGEVPQETYRAVMTADGGAAVIRRLRHLLGSASIAEMEPDFRRPAAQEAA